MTKSTRSPDQGKASQPRPEKPYPEFPLFAHATKRWAKKIRGKLHYFGSWDDPQAALDLYLEQRDDLYAGRKPRRKGDGLTMRDLCNRFLTAKQHQVDTGEITPRTFADYKSTTDRLITVFGKNRVVDDLAADDFESLRVSISKTRGIVALGNEITRTRVVFNFAYQNHLIDRPVRYGSTFKRPSKRVLRKARNGKGPRMFENVEIRALVAEASTQLKAMILLGVNCGFGNHDCGMLPLAALDLDGGWINYPRPKTGVERRCPLWKETVNSLQEVIKTRPAPKDPQHDSLVFVSKYGLPWAKETADSPVTKEMRKLLDNVTIEREGVDSPIYRSGLGFYALRHTFETIGGESRDQVAVNHIMGHADASMAAVYRERISDERLVAVTDHVHDWLYADADDDADEEPDVVKFKNSAG